ncbi:condensation domain-containing protein [Streptomyces bikiniensis]|uniref:condensation domain-containing protein n=1 Tax=Streptomyces bikiniensis TaxID=1896 RepID=UPI000AF4D2FD|nr:condensation domain-containing protein [Streptomyces bikiniensis]
MVNGYGPAESMGFTTTHLMAPGVDPSLPVPIGVPLLNKGAYVLDPWLNLCPPGVTGELYLAGEGLAHGYLGRSDLTASRFVPDLLGGKGGRLYRTGDLARFDREGRLVYEGRADDQIKIRGFRVEPGETETALLTHPAVTQAVVTVHEERLAAYLVTGGTTSPDEIRRYVADRLPDHLVPTHVTVLDRLPLTPNGFALGGHSLLAARLTNRIAEALDVRLTLRDVFERPTVAGLAELIAGRGGAPATELPPLVAGEAAADGLPPASFAQRRLWLLSELDGGSAAYNVPMVVRLDAGADVGALESALGAVIGKHAPLRTLLEVVDGEPRQRILPPERARLTVERVPVATDAALDAALARSAGRIFDLAADLPIRAQLLERPDGSAVLSLVLHHIATDGLSHDVFFTDLGRAYAGEVLEPPAVGYADYAVWQRRVLGAADDPESLLGRELAYWREALAGLPEEHGLALDRPRPVRASHRGGEVTLDLGSDVFERVVVLAREEGCTPFMVVHAALVAALTRLGAGTDLAIGSPVAGRGDEALAGLVGFFVNTLVLRTDSAGLPVATVAGTANGAAKFDLEFLLRSDDGRRLHGSLLYAADVFDAETVRRMTSLLGRVLDQVLTDPGLRLSDLEVLTTEQRALLTGPWAGSVAETGDGSLVVRFEEAAARFAERTALVDGGRRISYAELDASANRLAHLLRAHGLGRGDLAGVLLDRGVDFAVAVLAVVKAGAAYTLLDPDFPDERLRSAAADAGISLLLTAPAHAARIEGPWRTVGLPSRGELAVFPAVGRR